MQVQDVNRLLKQFDDMQRMMKKMKKGDGEDDEKHEGYDAAGISVVNRPGLFAILLPGCARHPHVLRVRSGDCA